MAEVEAQAVGRHERSLLLHVGSEHLPEGPVQEMGAGVVAADGLPSFGVDPRQRLLPRRHLALDHSAGVAYELSGDRVRRVGHDEGARVGADLAGVADLATRLGVEGCAVEEDLVAVHGEHPGFGFVVGIADELGGAELLEQLAVGLGGLAVGLVARPGAARPFPLLGHGHLKALFVDFDTALGRDLPGQLQREPVGVMQPEGDVAGEDRRVLADVRQLLVEDGRA